MATLTSIETARDLATQIPYVLTAVDTGPWMVAQYVPALGTGATAATIEIDAGSDTIQFYTDGATPTTTGAADAIGNTTGEILTSAGATNTMGEVVDKINAAQAWRAYLVGALRADDAGALLTKTEASCFGDNGLTFYGDNSAHKSQSLAISGEKFVNNGRNGWVKDWDSQCENSMLYASITVTSASLTYLKYYSGKQGSTEIQAGGSVALATATAKEQGEANLTFPYIAATRGERLIIRVIGVSGSSPTAPTFNIIGKSAVLDGTRMVTEKNY